MKRPSLGMKLKAVFTFLFLCCLVAQAQMPGAAGPTGVDMAMLKLFGDITNFTAKAQVRILDDTQQEVISMPIDFAMRDSNVRMDMDLTQAKGNSMPAGAAESLKQMGMAQLSSITRRDKNLTYVVYPGPKMLLSMPLPKEAPTKDSTAKLEKTEQGKEELDGHPCVKNKVVFADDAGKSIEALTWNATDIKDFPLQIQAKEKDNTSVIRFSDVKLTKPEAKLFDPPAGYTQYSNQVDLMQAMMAKMTQDAAPPKK